MARQRFIWPEIWSDPAFGRLNAEEKVLYIGLFSNADDQGRILADPAFLRSAVFPYQELTLPKMRKLRDRLAEKMGSVRLYSVESADYIELSNWSEWQKPKYPKASKLPAPPTPEGVLARESLGEASGKPSEAMGEAFSMGRDGLGRDGLGRAGLGVEPPTAEKTAALKKLLNGIREKDDATVAFISALAFKLPPAAFYDANEELAKRRGQPPPLDHEGKYAQVILQRMVDDGIYERKAS